MIFNKVTKPLPSLSGEGEEKTPMAYASQIFCIGSEFSFAYTLMLLLCCGDSLTHSFIHNSSSMFQLVLFYLVWLLSLLATFEWRGIR